MFTFLSATFTLVLFFIVGDFFTAAFTSAGFSFPDTGFSFPDTGFSFPGTGFSFPDTGLAFISVGDSTF